MTAEFDVYYSDEFPNIKVVVHREKDNWNSVTQYHLNKDGSTWTPWRRAYVSAKDVDSTVKGYLHEESHPTGNN